VPIQPAQVSVVDPVSLAIEWTKRLLFRPFDLGRWFVIGFCAWLAGLGQSGGANFNYRYGKHYNADSFRDALDHARAYFLSNIAWLLPLIIVLVAFSMAVGLLVLWLSSRGRFMFLHCVALNKAEVGEPWRQLARQGNSLFLFRLVLGLILLLPALPLFVAVCVAIWRMIERGAVTVPGILVASMAGLAFAAVCIVGAVISKLTTDFVVPIMFLRRNRCVESWKEFLGLLAANAGQFILYLLFQIVIAIVTGAIVIAGVLITCCLAGCVLIIPYIGTVLLLPILTFKRAYSLQYLAQYGPDYTVFPAG
jgi:hypothetical protein